MMLRRAGTATNALARAYFRHEGMKLRAVEQQTAAAFATHITCSELDSIRLREIVPDAHAVVVPNGVDCEFFASAGTPITRELPGLCRHHELVPERRCNAVLPARRLAGAAATGPRADSRYRPGSNPPDSLVQLGQSLAGVKASTATCLISGPLIDSAALFVCPIRDARRHEAQDPGRLCYARKCVVAHPIAPCEEYRCDTRQGWRKFSPQRRRNSSPRFARSWRMPRDAWHSAPPRVGWSTIRTAPRHRRATRSLFEAESRATSALTALKPLGTSL